MQEVSCHNVIDHPNTLTVSIAARELEGRALVELDRFVADEIKNNPARDPLRKVYESLKTWIANYQIPITPMPKNIIVSYAHEIFTAPGAGWKLDHRRTMLGMLESLRICANRPYKRDLHGVSAFREAFFTSVYEFPEAKALEAVDRDLTLDEDER